MPTSGGPGQQAIPSPTKAIPATRATGTAMHARMAYEAHVAELTKLGEMYAGLTRNVYKPVEQAAAKAGSPNRLRSA